MYYILNMFDISSSFRAYPLEIWFWNV